MNRPPRDRLPPMAIAMQWVSRITTVSLTMALPALGGVLLDGYLGTSPWLLTGGAVLGFAAAMSQLLKMATDQTSADRRDRDQRDFDSKSPP